MDYEKIGLKVGLEIHQQLGTHKLFCSCPSTIRDDEPDVVAVRKMKAVVGESGDIDTAASYEEGKNKHYKYTGYSDSTCLVEFDDEPPHSMNEEALKVVLSVAKHLQAEIVNEVQVMRKIVVDGSNTSGFQRTALVAMNGMLDGVRIESIAIEEDSAKIVARTAEEDVYNVSRLGIPLIEIGTAPDIKTPQQALEIAAKLGMILRSTGKVKRGLGTIRQDVNVSVAKGERVEIKGAQELKLIPLLIENEIARQQRIIELEPVFREGQVGEILDVSSLFTHTACTLVKNALEQKLHVFGFCVKKMHCVLGKELQPGKRVGSDLSEYAKVKAGVGGIIHSDEKLEKYRFSETEVNAVKKRLQCSEHDAFVLMVGEKKKAHAAHAAIKERLAMLGAGVPKEVRKANDDGTTTFLRPISGAARMYPETDVVPAVPDVKHILKIVLLSDRIGEVQKRYRLGHDLATALVNENLELFERLVMLNKNVNPAFLGEMIVSAEKNIKGQFGVEVSLSDGDFEFVADALNKNLMPKASVYEVLKEKDKEKALGRYKGIDEAEMQRVISEIVKKNPDASLGALMGICMKALGGKADGKKVSDLLKKNQTVRNSTHHTQRKD